MHGEKSSCHKPRGRFTPLAAAHDSGPTVNPSTYRAIFISDVHLGTRGCQAEKLLDFLRTHSCEQLFLVGDIIDLWRLKIRWYWPSAHNTVIQKILRMARNGVKVHYIRGNHDPIFEFFSELTLTDDSIVALGDIAIREEYVYHTAAGLRLWVIHGDQFDAAMRYARWLTHLGDHGYTALLSLNHYLQRLLQWLGVRHQWSLSGYVKYHVKKAVQFINDYESLLAEEALRRNYDGVICGHIHHPEQKRIKNIQYYNDGDWVESCSALVEHHDGQMEIVHWTQSASRDAIRAA
ncbi:UDP-2,3-diacylglucosamine diphosphatase [Acidiferrobacter sp.]|uniref:UDP-2,3-diacylglucosamine diphosphatase n=1 Tax=Acidiferrobacter sp. TaxID=1872107 RepID=UPI0026209CC9|nr:UDP-2,3-diacylglucosamine diphosphatase [Acidiferrobacter sp.]